VLQKKKKRTHGGKEGERKSAVTTRLKWHVNDPKVNFGHFHLFELEPGHWALKAFTFLFLIT
jgi:hypothetical protein